MRNTKISVIMSVYNCEETLEQALDSVLAQTYTDWEFIICNDCSIDGTQQILNRYKELYPERFILLRNDRNMRLAYSLNQCLKYATGYYIARMDGDDYCANDRFEKQIVFLNNHPEYDLVGSSMRRFSAEGPADSVKKPEHVDKYSMRRIVPFNHATIMTYKRVYDKLEGYVVAERTKRAQDYDLWFRFFHAGFKGYNLQEDLYFVREDMNAIRRRTFSVRWNAFKTTRIGYALLGFPKRWLIKPFISMLIKSLVPYRVISWYRGYQKKKK